MIPQQYLTVSRVAGEAGNAWGLLREQGGRTAMHFPKPPTSTRRNSLSRHSLSIILIDHLARTKEQLSAEQKGSRRASAHGIPIGPPCPPCRETFWPRAMAPGNRMAPSNYMAAGNYMAHVAAYRPAWLIRAWTSLSTQ